MILPKVSQNILGHESLVNNHLAQYAIMKMPTLHFHLDPTFIHSLSFQAILGGQGGVGGQKG